MLSYHYPDNPTTKQRNNTLLFLRSFADVLPCNVCSIHFNEYLDSTIPDVTSPHLDGKTKFTEWMRNFHNDVNSRLNKRVISRKEDECLHAPRVTEVSQVMVVLASLIILIMCTLYTIVFIYQK